MNAAGDVKQYRGESGSLLRYTLKRRRDPAQHGYLAI